MYKIKDIKMFAKNIFDYHATGTSLHQENRYDFTVDDKLRDKILKFIEIEKKS